MLVWVSEAFFWGKDMEERWEGAKVDLAPPLGLHVFR